MSESCFCKADLGFYIDEFVLLVKVKNLEFFISSLFNILPELLFSLNPSLRFVLYLVWFPQYELESRNRTPFRTVSHLF